jgi:WD40 repeat protein/tRNA A-37 threonylcarbamoyl transferase component Bud32
MSEPNTPDNSSLPLPVQMRIDAVCRRFEDALKAGQWPRLEDFLGQAEGTERLTLLRELLVLELHYRRCRGEQPTTQEYQTRFPDALALIDSLMAADSTTDNSRQAEATGPHLHAPATAMLPAIPGYEVLEELGHGGMGVVYRARQVKANRVVALKMILAGRHTALEARLRFQIEAEAVARLQHLHVVRLYEVGEQDGQPFFSLEFCPGGSLKRKWAGRPQPPWEAAALLQKLARAMAAAHAQGLVHRDLKPDNVLLGDDGEPRISDFGLARRVDEAGEHTGTGQVMGTPAYMAPEQAEGRTKEAGPAADIYSLGVLLYEALTGRVPFRGETMRQTLEMVCTQKPARPRRLRPGIPRDLETICLKCLRKEPEQRYATARELADDLGRFLDGRPIRARRTGWAERAVKWVRRRPGLAGLWTAVLLVAAVGLAAFAWQFRETRNEAWLKGQANDQLEEKVGELNDEVDRRRRAERLALTREQAALTEKDRAQRAALATQLKRAASLVHLDPYRARLLLEDCQHCPLHLRDFSWRLLYAQARRDASLPGTRWPVLAVAWSPDGRWLACAAGDRDGGQVVLHRTAGRFPLVLEAGDVVVHAVAFADARTVLAGCSDGLVRRWRLSWAGQPARRLRDLKGHADSVLCLASDGMLVASGGQDGLVCVHDLGTGQLVHVFREHTDAVSGVALGPTGGSFRKGRAGQVHELLPPPGIDGEVQRRPVRWLLSASLDGTACVWDMDTARRRHRLRPPGNAGEGLCALASSGSMVAVADRDGQVFLWRPGASSLSRAPVQSPRRVRALAFSPDGKYLALAPGREPGVLGRDRPGIRVVDVASGALQVELRGHVAEVQALAFEPDGKRLTSGAGEVGGPGEIKRWRLGGGPHTVVAPGLNARHGAGRGWVALLPEAGCLLGVAVVRGPRAVNLFTGEPHPLGKILFPEPPPAPLGGVQALGAAPNGAWLVALEQAGRAAPNLPRWRLWPLAGARAGTPIDLERPEQDSLGEPVFSGDGSVLAALAWQWLRPGDRPDELVAEPGRLVVWPSPARRRFVSFPADAERVAVLALDWAGKRAALAEGTGLIRVVSTSTGKELHRWQTGTPGLVSLAFSPDGRTLATGGGRDRPRTVQLWDVETGRRRALLAGHGQPITHLAFTSEGLLVSSSGSARGAGEVRVWDAAVAQERLLLPHSRGVWSFALDRRERLLVSLSGEVTEDIQDGPPGREPELTLRTWEIAPSIAPVVLRDLTSPPCLVGFAARNRLVAVAPADEGLTQSWDLTSGQGKSLGDATRGRWQAAALSADGRTLVTAREGQVACHDSGSGKVRYRWIAHQHPVQTLALSPDGRTVATGSTDATVRLWQADSGKPLRTLTGHRESVTALAWLPVGQRLASGDLSGAVRLWDLPGGKPARVLVQGGAGVGCLAFAADGKTLAAGGEDGAISLWDVALGKRVAALEGHPAGVAGLVFLSGPGEGLLSAGRDGTVRRWDLASGRCAEVLAGLPGPATALALSPDGRTVAVGCGEEGAGEVWLCRAAALHEPPPRPARPRQNGR